MQGNEAYRVHDLLHFLIRGENEVEMDQIVAGAASLQMQLLSMIRQLDNYQVGCAEEMMHTNTFSLLATELGVPPEKLGIAAALES